MKKSINASLVKFIIENFDDRQRADEVQELIEAIVAEIKQDYRKCRRRRGDDEVQELIDAYVALIKQDYRECRRRRGDDKETEAFFEGLICDVQTREFWEKYDYMNGFEFDY